MNSSAPSNPTASFARESNPDLPPRRAGGFLVLAAVCLILSSCAMPTCQMGALTPAYRPDNVFLYSPALPATLKRVAILPLACEGQRPDLEDGCQALSAVLQTELVRTKKFEVVIVARDPLRYRTGRAEWTGTEALPPDFFDSVRELYGCDAVLFCEVTTFRAYAPLAVGWRMRLVDVRTRQTLWAADELVDAGRQSVINGARRYHFTHQQTWAESQEDWIMQNSPRRFGQYAAARVLATLPAR